MSIADDGRRVYTFLTEEVIPRQAVTTYQEVNARTGVQFGVEGGYMGQVLGWVFRACDRRKLPPLTAIVVKAGVNQSELYDRPRNRYGMPSSGYFVALAENTGASGVERMPGLERWVDKPTGFDKDACRWEYRELIERHQESVWNRRVWPSRL